ncbi:hypothetical protein HYS31_05420 [Candidatus Woesearchaeota archaeon]|nr:hypothetical protein [Candidatus Woesearchaeota archaeon]
MAEGLPNAVPPQEQKEEKKEKGALENLIDELGSFARKALLFGSLAIMPFVYMPFDASHVPRAAVTAAGFSAGKIAGNLAQNEPIEKGAFKAGMVGTALSLPLATGFRALNNLETIVAADYGNTVAKTAKVGAFLGIHQPAISTMRTAMNYGIGKEFRKHWWTGVKDTFKTLGILGTINVLFVYTMGLLPQMIYAGLLSFVYNTKNAFREAEKKASMRNLLDAINPLSYAKATATVSYKLGKNTIGGIYDALYSIGSGLSGGQKTAPYAPGK